MRVSFILFKTYHESLHHILCSVVHKQTRSNGIGFEAELLVVGAKGRGELNVLGCRADILGTSEGMRMLSLSGGSPLNGQRYVCVSALTS